MFSWLLSALALWADGFRDLERLILRSCSWPEIQVLHCFFSIWPYTDASLPHPWDSSMVPCHGHRIWLPMKSSVSPVSLEVSQLPFLSRPLEGDEIKLFPAPIHEEEMLLLSFFPSWNWHLSTAFCFLCLNWLTVAKRASSLILLQWNFFI